MKGLRFNGPCELCNLTGGTFNLEDNIPEHVLVNLRSKKISFYMENGYFQTENILSKSLYYTHFRNFILIILWYGLLNIRLSCDRILKSIL